MNHFNESCRQRMRLCKSSILKKESVLWRHRERSHLLEILKRVLFLRLLLWLEPSSNHQNLFEEQTKKMFFLKKEIEVLNSGSVQLQLGKHILLNINTYICFHCKNLQSWELNANNDQLSDSICYIHGIVLVFLGSTSCIIGMRKISVIVLLCIWDNSQKVEACQSYINSFA